MSQQFVKNEIGTFDECYKGFFIRPTEAGFIVLNPDSTPTGYTPKTRALAVAVIDTKHRRCELLIEEAAKKIAPPAIDTLAIMDAAATFADNFRKMGRSENRSSDLI
jgi:hypothetical protein